MPIKIKVNLAASNKPDYTPKNILKPHIDKLTVALKLNDATAHDSYMALFQNLDADDLFLDESQAKIPSYNLAKRIVLPSVGAHKKLPLLHVKYIKDEQLLPKLRLEFVPVDIGPQGIAELHTQLTSFVDGGWGKFVKSATITRIDVAVDIPDLTMDSVHLLPAKAATSQQWSPNGQLEPCTWASRKVIRLRYTNAARSERNRGRTGLALPHCVSSVV